MKEKHLRSKIIKFLQEHPKDSFNYKQIAKALRITDENQKALIRLILEDLANAQQIEEVRPGKFKAKEQFVEGIMDITLSGAGFLITDKFKEDIYIPPEYVHNALDGDEVKVKIIGYSRGRFVGEVHEILKRNRTIFVGTADLRSNYFLVYPQQKTIPPFIVPFENVETQEKIKPGDKVVVELIRWKKRDANPLGKIVRVLRHDDPHKLRNEIILIENGFPTQFPQEALEEANQFPEQIPEEEYANRLDLRHIPVFTIDPADARDFDDALSIQQLPDGNFEVGIHIADVSHYVRPGSALDREARRRGTSVYLVDAVNPMLPERLSSHLCSLVPHQDRLAFSVIATISPEGKVIKWFPARTVIRSRKRFTYDEAQETLEKGEGQFFQELNWLNNLAKIWREERFKRGSLNLESPELKFHLDIEGVPIGVYMYERKDAHFLIEEFMLLANRLVAEKMAKTKHKKQPFPSVFRIHDSPPEDKLKEFATFVKSLGYKFRITKPENIAKQFQKLLAEVEGKPEQYIIEQMAIRTMAKAEYSPKNIGHYGLKFKYYTHFTSPIRRYPDILVHRILWAAMNKKKPPYSLDQLSRLCKHATLQEIQSLDAERLSLKFMQAEFMKQNIGKIYDGLIVAIIKKGIFVEITDLFIEGFIPSEHLPEPYVPDPDNFKARAGDFAFKVGDAVRVRVAEANDEDGTITLELAE
ncbi:MAG: ribonuclease R [Chlorobi bacterium]|nr:ribonuclease R [Chlorobiota bacterium]